SRQGEPHQLKRFYVCLTVDYVALRDVADPRVAPVGRSSEYLDRAADGLLQSQEQAEECCLSSRVWPDDGHELSSTKGEVGVSPNYLVPVPGRQVFGRYDA